MKATDINKKGLTHLLADDLFAENIKQVFSAKSGKWLGTLEAGETFAYPDPEDQPQQPEPKDKNQLSLF